jgi:hypothetical protein
LLATSATVLAAWCAIVSEHCYASLEVVLFSRV